jgi:hypothetical protein
MERSELRDRMFALVKQWEESGDSQHDFAEKHQISRKHTVNHILFVSIRKHTVNHILFC